MLSALLEISSGSGGHQALSRADSSGCRVKVTLIIYFLLSRSEIIREQKEPQLTGTGSLRVAISRRMME